jgi:tRNA-2-methylthio-N6-dimethylallyladenosine synthase
MKFLIKTYGCQMNERDTETAAALLLAQGHTPAAGEADADLILINTCSVRDKAENKALGKLRLMAATKRERPGRRVGAMGCMVQRMKESLFEKVPGLDFAVGTHRLANLPRVLDRVTETNAPVLEAGDGGPERAVPAGHVVETPAVSSFVNILLGCNRRCAYCVVPLVRGNEWSRPAPEIVEEVRQLAAAGIREVTLLGQSVMAYGQIQPVWPDNHRSPLGFREPLARLLEAVSGVEGIRRVRVTSGHPSGCTAELARVMAELPAVCGHLHLPLQSGSDRILGLMNRGYASDDYRRAVERLRAAVPDMAFTTDIIVGFPTESAEDFERTRRLMEEIQFDNSFIFKYSPRPGTPAAAWTDDVPAGEKARRNRILLVDQDRHGLARNSRQIGRDVEVLVEGESLRSRSRWAGRTRANMTVVFPPKAGMNPGSLVRVRITRAMPQTLYGDVR